MRLEQNDVEKKKQATTTAFAGTLHRTWCRRPQHLSGIHTMIARTVRRTLSTSADRSMSLLAALEDESARRRRWLIGGGALVGAYWAYDHVVRAYAFMLLGSSATEQLFMQRLEGTVELEMKLRNCSFIGHVCGRLTPVHEAPHTAGPMNHRAFSILANASVSNKTKARHAAAVENQLPPVTLMREVSVLAPLHLSALFSSEPEEEVRLFCRKSRDHGTEYFSEKPRDWGGGSLNDF